ncbi:hypothetical protein [Azospirillum sp. TSO35-2]|uniref:hypothetical protein n=1 Tax=Azospirillum sp. TSO35-2 TaxID=716796 RepID=UPI000D622B04|nr:hypothetical protein [Azospirillum sp. TSO35-2]PWC37614.1 hypothetical protein TSO352_08775 [Azospirillum sp. TSO35-2]
MSGSGIGSPEFTVRTATGVERTGSATDRRQRRNPRQELHDRQQERREQNPPNPQRRRLYDLLFDEVDQFDGLNDRQRDRLKANLRDHLTARAPPPAATPPPEHDEEALAAAVLNDPAAAVPVDPEHIVRAATGAGESQSAEDAETARLAQQLRDCLARNSDRARKVAVYLHLLLTLEGAFRPHMIVDV